MNSSSHVAGKLRNRLESVTTLTVHALYFILFILKKAEKVASTQGISHSLGLFTSGQGNNERVSTLWGLPQHRVEVCLTL